MSVLPQSLQDLIEQLSKLPGIGPKTATRLALSMLNWSEEDLERFGLAASQLKSRIRYCSNCYTMTESELCDICSDSQRDRSLVAVVEKPLDVAAIEGTGDFHGLYHVLGGAIAPLDGITPETLRIRELITKINNGTVAEVILATNPNLEGETTAMYISKQLQNLSVKVTRIARGLPIGGELEYADEVTLTSAMENRREYGK